MDLHLRLPGVADGAACFVLGLHLMNSPATGRNGNRLSATGMTIAVVATLVWLVTRTGGLRGGRGDHRRRVRHRWRRGLYMARTVKMTAMPQLVSLFNAVGGGAAALVAIDDYLKRSGTAVPTSPPRSSWSLAPSSAR